MHIPLTELVQQDLHKPTFHALFDAMRRRAVTSLTYTFDGSGDSGTLESGAEEWEGFHDGIEPKDMVLDAPVALKEPNGTMYQDGQSIQMYDDATVYTLEELGHRCASIVLNNDPHDWYNNDGGFGKVIFLVDAETGKNKIEMDMNVREVTSEAFPEEAEFAHG